jgi:signal transduction histidine kinase
MVFPSTVFSGGFSRAHALAFLNNRCVAGRRPAPSLAESLADVPALLSVPAGNFRVVVEGRQRELEAGLHDEIYRIGREAIINAFRHSGATDIETQIEYRRSELRILIRDNGCGIDPENLQRGRNANWGLLGMRERADRSTASGSEPEGHRD